MSAEAKFPHRHNADGTWDSICKRCFNTVAHCETESELALHEKEHVCGLSHEPASAFKSPPMQLQK
jgi:hypothetical protein